jgi:hypothetical protein
MMTDKKTAETQRAQRKEVKRDSSRRKKEEGRRKENSRFKT